MYQNDRISKGIPKILNQIYIDFENKKDYLAPIHTHSKNCKDLYTRNGWEYKLWTMKDPIVGQLWKKYYYLEKLGRVDMIRYELATRYGGFFIDLDFICLKPIKFDLTTLQFVGTRENKDISFSTYYQRNFHLDSESLDNYFANDFIVNGFMGATKNNPILNHLITFVENTRPAGAPWVFEGPVALSHFVNLYPNREELVYVETENILPYHYSELGLNNITIVDPQNPTYFIEDSFDIPNFIQLWSSTRNFFKKRPVGNKILITSYFNSIQGGRKCDITVLENLLESMVSNMKIYKYRLLVILTDSYCPTLFKKMFKKYKIYFELVLVPPTPNDNLLFKALDSWTSTKSKEFINTGRFVYIDSQFSTINHDPFRHPMKAKEIYVSRYMLSPSNQKKYKSLLSSCLPDYQRIDNSIILSSFFAMTGSVFQQVVSKANKLSMKGGNLCIGPHFHYAIKVHESKLNINYHSHIATPVISLYNCESKDKFAISVFDSCKHQYDSSFLNREHCPFYPTKQCLPTP